MSRLRLHALASLAAALALAGCLGDSVVGGRLDGGVVPMMDAPKDTTDAVACPPPLLSCNDRCVDPRSDRENCGGCRRACSAAELCQNGACVPDCAAGETRCMTGAGLACVSLQTSREHCGACGMACGRD